MENKMFNQPPYNTEYKPTPVMGGYEQPPQPTAPYQTYPNQDYNVGYAGYAPAPPTGYSVAPPAYYGQPQPMAMAPPVPVGFVNTTAPEPPIPPTNDDVEDHFGKSFTNKNIRRVFVRKVYSILMLQLLFTFGVVALFIFQKDVKAFVQKNIGFYFASYAVFLVTYITLACCPAVRRRYPTNIICLAIFTLALSYMTGTISSFYDTQVVFIAAGMCAGVCLGITLLSMWSKFDVTGCGLYLCMLSLVLFWFGIMCCWTYNYVVNTIYCALAVMIMMMFDITGCGIYLAVASWVLFFFGLFAIFTYNDITRTVYSALAAVLMMFFLAYDTQMIIGGKRHEISPEEHIIASLSLYLDIVYIFIILLGLVGRGK